MTSPRPLLVVALPMESQGILEELGFDVLYTGVGKVNAALALSLRLARSPASYSFVINFGSAGSHHFPTGTLVEVSHFVQRDMDVTGLGFDLGTTPFDDTPAVLECAKIFEDLPSGYCGTGDSFVQSNELAVACDLVDMEGFALAKVCRVMELPFTSLKYVTDGADHEASKNWEKNLLEGARTAAKWLNLSQWDKTR